MLDPVVGLPTLNGGRSRDRPPLRWAPIISFVALLPNELAEDPSVAASLCVVDPRFRFTARLRHRMVALCIEVRATALLALCHSAGASHRCNPNRFLRHFIPLARSAWLCYRPLHHRVEWAFPLRRPVDYDAKLSCLSESYQHKISVLDCG
jgi:hypothetical protein